MNKLTKQMRRLYGSNHRDFSEVEDIEDINQTSEVLSVQDHRSEGQEVVTEGHTTDASHVTRINTMQHTVMQQEDSLRVL